MLIILYQLITVDTSEFVHFMEVHIAFHRKFATYFFACSCFSLSDIISLGSGATDGFIKANSDANGFYRVNYDIDNWKKIIDHLNNDDFISMVREQMWVGG